MFETDQNRKPLSASEQVIVDYITANKEEFTGMKIGELAKATYTSNATIIRLCRKLGMEGYTQLREYVIKAIETEKYTKKSVDFTKPIENDRNALDVISSMSSLYIDSIDVIRSSLRASDIQTIAEILYHSKRQFLYAFGDTQATCEGFINKMIKLNYFPIMGTARSDYHAISERLTSQDAVIIATYSGSDDQFRSFLPIIRSSGAKIIAVTANKNSLAAKAADILLLFPNEEQDEKIATFYSQLAFTYIFSILYSMLYLKGIRKS